jgi:KaiC/GvpD/RAD55 family RecA-like ATPase
MQKLKTGIPGLDPLIGGGIPLDSVVLLSGSPGAGKTIMALQFLAQGAIRHNQKALFVSFEEREDKIRDQAAQFGWNFKKLEKDGMLKIINVSSLSLGQIFTELKRAIKESKPRRMVIDSITYMALSAQARKRVVDLEDVAEDELVSGSTNALNQTTSEWYGLSVRKMLVDLVKLLEKKKICTLLTSEVSKNSEWYSRDTLSEFAADGIIQLKSTSIGSEMQRTMEIVKMRNTNIKGGIYDFEFGKSGLSIRK